MACLEEEAVSFGSRETGSFPILVVGVAPSSSPRSIAFVPRESSGRAGRGRKAYLLCDVEKQLPRGMR
jgi:hypothetical protein